MTPGEGLLIDYIAFYAVSAIFRPYNGGPGEGVLVFGRGLIS